MSKLKFWLAQKLVGEMRVTLSCPHGKFTPGHYKPGRATRWGCNESESGCVKLDIDWVRR